jgi:hypothetical protein
MVVLLLARRLRLLLRRHVADLVPRLAGEHRGDNCSTGRLLVSCDMNVCQIAAGQVPPKPPPPSAVSVSGEL